MENKEENEQFSIFLNDKNTKEEFLQGREKASNFAMDLQESFIDVDINGREIPGIKSDDGITTRLIFRPIENKSNEPQSDSFDMGKNLNKKKFDIELLIEAISFIDLINALYMDDKEKPEDKAFDRSRKLTEEMYKDELVNVDDKNSEIDILKRLLKCSLEMARGKKINLKTVDYKQFYHPVKETENYKTNPDNSSSKQIEDKMVYVDYKKFASESIKKKEKEEDQYSEIDLSDKNEETK